MENNTQQQQQQSPVLVIGATGFLGMEVCKQLRQAGKNVRGLVRKSAEPRKVESLKEMGVETVIGDLKDISSLYLAFNDVKEVISTASSSLSRAEGDNIETVDKEGQKNAIDASVAAQVKHFVFISFHEMLLEFPLQTAKRTAEKYLKDSKLSYTILQPSFFMDIWLSPALGFDYPNAKAAIFGDGKKKMPWIALKDVAAFAVASLDIEAAKNKTFELGGPEGVSLLEAVKIFEEITGKPFGVEHVPAETLLSQFESTTDPLQRSFAALSLSFIEGKTIDMNETLKTFPIELTSVREYAKRVTTTQEELV